MLATRLSWPAWLRPSAFPVLGLIACLAGTLALYVVANNHQRRQDQQLFDAETAKLINGMRQSMTASETLLRAAAGLVMAHPDLPPDDWRVFVNANDLRQRFPGFQGIGYLKFSGQEIALGTGGSLPSLGATGATGPLKIAMLEPALWADSAALTERDPPREAAMARARDLDVPARTSLLRFAATASSPSELGFLCFAPVYGRRERYETVPQRRRALTGFVVMPFAMPTLVRGLMQNRYQEARENFLIEIFDGRPTSGVRSFDSTEQDGYDAPVAPQLTSDVVTERFGTEMGYRFSSRPAYEDAHQSWLPKALLVAGMGLSALVYGLLQALHHHFQFATAARHDSDTLRFELVHRVRNMLAVVQSLANRSLPEEGEGHQQFAHRIDALARAHTMIVENAWLGADIGELIRSELAPLAQRATATGPEVALSPQVSQSLALAVNELAIEAVGRGVQSLNITWVSVAKPEPAAVITWNERGGSDERGWPAERLTMLGFSVQVGNDKAAGAAQYVITVPLD